MRLRSLHPHYLDTKGLVALWREALLAKHVLEGKTKGYTNHPQLDRFKASSHPLHAINAYLAEVWYEADKRGYRFDKNKIDRQHEKVSIPVTQGQIHYEHQHLLRKLEVRDKERFLTQKKCIAPDIHTLFTVIA